MKRPSGSSGVAGKRIGKRKKAKNDANLNEMLRMCLTKLCEMQHELNKADEDEDDAQAAGYAACAVEALDFLAREGIPQEHPMVRALADKLTANATEGGEEVAQPQDNNRESH